MRKKLTFLLVLAALISILSMTGCDEDSSGARLTLIVPKDTAADYTHSAMEGVRRLETDYGIHGEIKECTNNDFLNVAKTATEKSDYVVIVGFESEDVVDLVSIYPDTEFILIDTIISNEKKYDNALCITYDRRECAFLAGYLSAKLADDKMIGVDSALEEDLISGFYQGAKAADSAARIKKNSDEKICFSADGEIICEDKVVAFMKTDVGSSIYDVVKFDIEEGSWYGGKAWKADMSSGYISLKYSEENEHQWISAELKSEMERTASKIISGEIKMEAA